MEADIDNAFLNVGISCPKPLEDTGILCGTTGGIKRYCWFRNVKPKTDRVLDATVSMKSQVNLKQTDYELQFTIKNYDCVNPRVTFKYRPIDNDGATEYLRLYDDDDSVIATCSAGIQKGCSEWFTCVNDKVLGPSSIAKGSSYTLRIRTGPDINYLCTINGHKLSMDATMTLSCDAALSPTTTPTAFPTPSPTPAPSRSPTASPIHNTYSTATSTTTNEVVWSSTSSFLPEQSSSFGQIRIGHRMSAHFDFEWSGRTDTPRTKTFENFFRIGFDAVFGTGCSGQSSRYPALWLTAKTNELYLSLSQSSSCTKGHTLPFGEIALNTPYRMAISWDDTVLNVAMEELDGVNSWTTSYDRDGTLSAHIGAMAEVWWMSSKFGASEYNVGGGRFWNVTFRSSVDTADPTMDPTSSPTARPTVRPTPQPTLSPVIATNEWTESEQPFAAEGTTSVLCVSSSFMPSCYR